MVFRLVVPLLNSRGLRFAPMHIHMHTKCTSDPVCDHDSFGVDSRSLEWTLTVDLLTQHGMSHSDNNPDLL